MSNILETESNAVITVKKTSNQFAKFYGFEVLPKCCRWCINLIYTNYASPTLRNIMAYNMRRHLLVVSEKKIKMLNTAFVTAQRKLL